MIPVPPKPPSTTLIAAIAAVAAQVVLIIQSRDWELSTALRRTWKAAGVIRHPILQLKIVRTLLRGEARRLAVAEPLVMFKHLGDYLARGLSRADRAQALLAHYSFLESTVRKGFFDQIMEGEIELWRLSSEDHRFSIGLAFPHETHHEGDLSLLFRLDETCIYTLSFSIGPGSIAGTNCARAMYVVRIQGKGRGFDSIRLATRACGDISPAALLLAAAEGLALALGVDEIIGVGAKCQLSQALDSRPDGLASTYDDFWLAVGGRPLEGAMYSLNVPMPEKPISEIKRHHRSRALRKREFRASVCDCVTSSFRSRILERRASVRGQGA